MNGHTAKKIRKLATQARIPYKQMKADYLAMRRSTPKRREKHGQR